MFVSPLLQLLGVAARRARLRRRIARARGSSIIGVVHHMETLAVFGVPLVHWVSMPLTRETARAVAQAPAASRRHRRRRARRHRTGRRGGLPGTLQRTGKVTLIVPQYALSGALLLALAADEILMDEEAALGALDLRIDGRAAAGVMLDRTRSPRAPQRLSPFPRTGNAARS